MKWFNRKKKQLPHKAELPQSGQTLKIDESSPTWLYVAKTIAEKIEAKRKRNDMVSLDEKQTATLRGEIKALKSLLNLPNEQAESSRPGILSRHVDEDAR